MKLKESFQSYILTIRVEVYGIGIKFLMTAASIFITSLKWLSPVQSFLALCLLWNYMYWQPHMFKVPNMVSLSSSLGDRSKNINNLI